MRKLCILLPVLYMSTLAACVTAPATQLATAPHRAILLVSLEDGSVVLQMIDSDADICFKNVSSSATTCLHQGPAIVDAETDTVVGFEMFEEQIDLIPAASR